MTAEDKETRWRWLLLLPMMLALQAWGAAQGTSAPKGCTGPPSLEGRRSSAEAHSAALGDWFLQHRQPGCAADVFRALVGVTPHFPVALDGLARSYLAQGNAAAAIGLLRGAPPAEPLTVDLATAYEQSGDIEQAGRTLVGAMRSAPGSARLASALVLLMANHGQMDEAYAFAGKFAGQHPHDLNAQKLYLRVLVAANDTAAARPLAKKLLEANPTDGELLYLSGVLERKAGEFEAAKTHLQRSVAINPNFADSHDILGRVLLQMGNARGAKEQMQAALQLGATDPETHLNLSKAMRGLGETEEADAQLLAYQEGIKAKSNSEMAASKASDAEQALTQGDKQKAVTLYREALEVKPGDAKLAYGLGMALDAAGDTAGERKALETAVQADPSMALAQHQLGYLLFQSGENDAAEQHFRLALRAAPEFTQAWISLAATLATKSEFAGAREAIDHALRLDPHNSEAEQMKRMLPAASASR